MTTTAPPRAYRLWDSDLAYSFRRSPVAMVSAAVLLICLAASLFAPWVAPHNPFDLATLNLLDALTPPHGLPGAKPDYLLGTDDQGRDVLSAIMFGARISLLVGLASVVFAMLLGITLGLIAGYGGGKLDAFIMRIADVQLSFLGVGVPPTQPSLGTLIRIGNDFLFSGEWWITIFPGAALVIMVLAINLLGDWLRDALNPKLQ